MAYRHQQSNSEFEHRSHGTASARRVRCTMRGRRTSAYSSSSFPVSVVRSVSMTRYGQDLPVRHPVLGLSLRIQHAGLLSGISSPEAAP
jgi:hypothetical protein